MVGLNKDTVLCISVASRASNFGTVVHNYAYQALGLNFIYKAFEISDIAAAIAGVRGLGIRGCSVSMPFKETVIDYLDELDTTAAAIGAVNTVVNNDGYLIGYNTDVVGATVALQALEIQPQDKVLLLGAGGMAKAIAYSLQQLGIRNILFCNRTASKLAEKKVSYEVVPWQERNESQVDILINATSLGMQPNPEVMPVEMRLIQHCRSVMDAIVSPLESKLINAARDANKKVVPGYKISLHQAAEQFYLYTGVKAPLDILEKAVLEMLQQT